VNSLPHEAVAAVGRITIAAGDLELILAVIGADQAGGDAFKVLSKPGEPLRAARGSIEFAPSDFKVAYLPVVETAAQLLARRHAVVHAMWVNDAPNSAPQHWELLHYKTHVRQPADPRMLDELARQLMDTRNRLVQILTAQINKQPIPTQTP
jgi:hypothetical protein